MEVTLINKLGFVKQMVWPGPLPWDIKIPVPAFRNMSIKDEDHSRLMFETLVFVRQGGTNVYEESI